MRAVVGDVTPVERRSACSAASLEYAVLTGLVSRREIEAALARRGHRQAAPRLSTRWSSEGARADRGGGSGGCRDPPERGAAPRLEGQARAGRGPASPSRATSRAPDVDADLHWGTVPAVTSDGTGHPPGAHRHRLRPHLRVRRGAVRGGLRAPRGRGDPVRAPGRGRAASPRTGRAQGLRGGDRADGRADNPFESCIRAIASRGRRPGRGAAGAGRRGSGGWTWSTGGCGIVIECESFEFHSDRKALRKDIRRYTEAARRGWVVVRFTWEQVMSEPGLRAAVLVDIVRLRTTEAVRRPS